MGIRGLKSFIENNSDLKTRHRLHDSYLVIDGNNLIYDLFWRSSRDTKDYIYGGDYNRFATTVQHFFKTLQKCSIEALVVLDGGIDPSQQKVKTIIQRFRKNLEEAKRISKGNICNERIIPSLCKPVLLEVLSLLSVPHIQASYEADNFIAQIANHLKCPVLSNDSDFFVFDLQFGVISIECLMTSLTVKTYQTDPNDPLFDYKYLDCDLFLIENLIDYFPGLRRDILPLFSTLMGNDWVDSHVFDNIFNAIPSVWTHSRKKSKSLHVGKRHQRMAKLLSWLRNRSVEESIDYLITSLRTNSRNSALSLLQISLENYSNVNSFEQSFNESLDFTQLSALLPNKEESIPQWFANEFHKSLMSTTFMNIIKMKTDFLSPRVEDFSLSSSYSSGLELRQYLYALLRIEDKDIDAITVFDRNGTKFCSYQLDPKPLTPNRLQLLPTLCQIRDISIDERRLLLEDILSIDLNLVQKITNVLISGQSVEEHKNIDTNGAVFLIITMRYWCQRCDHKIWFEMIYSLVTTVVFSGFIGSFNKIKFIFFNQNSIKESIDLLSKFNVRPIHNSAKLYQPRVIHFFNEFLDCLKNIRSLNLLFDSPFQMGNPFFCLNGMFIYNLTVELSSRKDPVLYLSQLFGRQSLATKIFKELLDIVFDGLDSNLFVRCFEVMNRRTHIQSQKIRSKSNRNKPKLENRFSALKVESI